MAEDGVTETAMLLSMFGRFALSDTALIVMKSFHLMARTLER